MVFFLVVMREYYYAQAGVLSSVCARKQCEERKQSMMLFRCFLSKNLDVAFKKSERRTKERRRHET